MITIAMAASASHSFRLMKPVSGTSAAEIRVRDGSVIGQLPLNAGF